MIHKSVDEFTEILSSSAAIPGGGGASALVGALAVSLGSMVGSLTLNKKKYADVQEEIKDLMDQSEKLRIKLLDGIHDDAVAFEPLSKAYGISKENPDRDEILEKCLQDAANAPYQIMLNVCSTIELLERYGKIGSKLAISDAATGSVFAYAALKGAAINVKVNTKLMKNKEYAQKLNEQVDQLVNEYEKRALNVYDEIMKGME